MLGTKTLFNPVHSLLAKVHHPPPLNQRESQRLLNALTTSFRKNLDKEHGFWPQSIPADPPRTSSAISGVALSGAAAAASAGPSHHDSHRRPTDRHVRAILSNPLFSYDPYSAPPPAERDPMDVFDRAVAKGLMSPQRAAGILMAKSQAISQSSSLSIHESMASSGTALRVLQWLRSSGLERSLTFVESQALLNNLLPFMIEEGLEEVAWTWLDRWMRGDGHGLVAEKHTAHASNLLHLLVRSKISPGTTLDSGYASIIRASDMFRTNDLFDAIALKSWRTLSVSSTVYAWQRSRPSEALFDTFAAMSEQLRKLAKWVQIDRAHLDLHHPTHPDATLAVKYLKSPILESLKNRMTVKRIVFMATDAAQHLTRSGHEAEAELVGNLVLENLGAILRRELRSAASELRMFKHPPEVRFG
ncbi:hypothetical protein BD289DRAFT_459768 [Coniella lustricola]|uniref:Uncharacterized protein n=1 Tax=Coniella lustricola TaxID=2025994 RepID=A0A2T3AD00_9PEZI|nr:hypothetical protein BD289DRAFT_459768 [Coniella lustricola]